MPRGGKLGSRLLDLHLLGLRGRQGESRHGDKEESEGGSHRLRAGAHHLHKGTQHGIEEGIATHHTKAYLAIATGALALVHLSPGHAGAEDLTHLLEGRDAGQLYATGRSQCCGCHLERNFLKKLIDHPLTNQTV